MSLINRKYPSPYYGGHYFHDTQVTLPRWHVVVLTVLRYSGSLLWIQIDVIVQHLA